MLFALVAAIVFAQATPASAPISPAAATPPSQANDVTSVTVLGKKQKGNEDPHELVCHSEIPIGSRFPVKVCASRQNVGDRRLTDQMEIRKMTALRPGSGN